MTDYNRDHEWRTLAEHNVQPGDVLQWDGSIVNEYIAYQEPKPKCARKIWASTTRGSWLDEYSTCRVIARAAQPAPTLDTTNPDRKPWRDMTDAEKGALLLAAHEFADMDKLDSFGVWIECHDSEVGDDLSTAYRTRPKPKRETVKRSLHGAQFMGYVAIDLLDGEPQWDTLRKWSDDLA